MKTMHELDERRQLALSALMDGEADAPLAARAVRRLARRRRRARARWHAYHLIGDVLRSEIWPPTPRATRRSSPRCARGWPPSRSCWRRRPAAAQRAARGAGAAAPVRRRSARRCWRGGRRRRAVAGRRSSPWPALSRSTRSRARCAAATPVVAAAPAAAVAQPAPRRAGGAGAGGVAAPSPAEPQALVADGKLIRDARLDRYLAAHKQFGGSPALGVPSGFAAQRALPSAER